MVYDEHKLHILMHMSINTYCLIITYKSGFRQLRRPCLILHHLMYVSTVFTGNAMLQATRLDLLPTHAAKILQKKHIYKT